MLSRVAENLYWISRYVERAEGLARLLDDAFSMELEEGSRPDGAGPLDNVLLMLSARAAFARSRPPHPDGAPDQREAVLRFLTFGRAGGVSIRETVAGARENARGTQETLSGEAWSQLNKLHLFLNSPRAAARFAASPSRFLDRVRRECVLFAALVDGTLPRTEAYHFLQVGRHLERVDMLSRVINVHCYASAAFVPAGVGSDVTFSAAHWASLLRGTSAYEAYQKQARERVDPVGVVRYLLLEAEFPRSMRFGVARCLESLRCVAGGGGFGTDAERHLGRLDSELRYMDVDDLFRRGVDQFLVGVQETCAAVGRDVHQAYFRT
ncbi:MAG: alpha-E domain-containing protein [Isosphaera sp.]|nr:alpha-E domain-containing protein [Isosphaera sp.]